MTARHGGRYLLAIDAGTGSCRAVLFDAGGRQAAIAAREYAHDAEPGVPGSQRFDTTRNWQLICQCIGGVLASAGIDAGAVAAVGATSMREGIVLYDDDGEVLWACPNVDSRAGDQATELIRSGRARQIYDTAGDWVSITSPARLLWLAEHEPGVVARTRHLGMLGDWIVTSLCGAYVTDPSLGSSSGMFDLAERRWSSSIVSWCGLDPAVLPEVVEPGTVVGSVSARASAQTGLAAGTPVVVGGADTQLALVGIGVAAPNATTLVGGSFWQTTLVAEAPLVDRQARLRTLCHSVPGQWMVEGIGFYCGLAMRWFREAFCEVARGEAAASGTDVYHLLEREAARLDAGSNGVVAILSNVMQADRWVHASPAFVGFDLADPASARASCLRSIEESAAYVARAHQSILEELSGSPTDRLVFTGGAANGRLWPQVVADVLGVTVQIPAVKESTALGAALYAGAGVGWWDDAVATGAALVSFEREIEPDAARHARYDELYDSWRAIYRHQLELVESGLSEPLWQAAGVELATAPAAGGSRAGARAAASEPVAPSTQATREHRRGMVAGDA
jgi:autoinducer 2 (AI-2) kinase